MSLAILSDSHDNLPNLKKTLEFCLKENITEIIHCGDLTRVDSLIKAWPKNLEAKIHFVYGNADQEQLIEENQKKLKNFKSYGQIGIINKKNKKFAFTHYPFEAKKLAQKQKYDYVFYGHTHKPWAEEIGRTKLINPGNLSGTFYKASFAVLNLEKNKLSLKMLNEL